MYQELRYFNKGFAARMINALNKRQYIWAREQLTPWLEPIPGLGRKYEQSRIKPEDKTWKFSDDITVAWDTTKGYLLVERRLK